MVSLNHRELDADMTDAISIKSAYQSGVLLCGSRSERMSAYYRKRACVFVYTASKIASSKQRNTAHHTPLKFSGIITRQVHSDG